MATSILESDRTDRYEFEVFIGQVDFAGYKSLALEKEVKRKVTENPRLKTNPLFSDAEDLHSEPKYTIKIVLDDVLQSDISSYDEIDREREKHHHNDSKSSDSLTNIVKQIAEHYIVDEEPVCNALSLCYHFKDESVFGSSKMTINRGVVCIFNCTPRTLIKIFQKNPLELTTCEDLRNGRVEFGTLSIPLSGSTGFTNAISYHFYEKGSNPYTHTVQGVHKVIQHGAGGGGGVQTVVGQISVRMKLTCHGPRPGQQQQRVDRVVWKPVRPPLRPVHVDENAFDFPLDKRTAAPPPKMTYCDTVGGEENKIRVVNPEIRELLRCRSVQESLANETSNPGDRRPCCCPCRELMKSVKETLNTCRSAGRETAAGDERIIRSSLSPPEELAETTLGPFDGRQCSRARADDSPFGTAATADDEN